ncbi:hypothetical protein Ami103574_04085 [Aminipila butyrica]|uniref:Uncharacterized protein n=1 Tax=Aminipila butyrica TaxID=433296 RepID=A0A858BTM8_9FIRM|nr:hypothetical protein [Aminipila butyrica]QIB68549.1 hypothetical protein Ami103574_04085 [Aminipila butyrica]
MDSLKKAGILTGAAVGGVIGGTLSVVGKVTRIKIIDTLGSSIVDSTIYTGAIAGDLASGTTDLISGKLTGNAQKVADGVEDLKEGGSKVAQNVVGNLKLLADNGGEILTGVKERDRDKIKHGAKNLAMATAVGLITVGAVKIDEGEEEN